MARSSSFSRSSLHVLLGLALYCRLATETTSATPRRPHFLRNNPVLARYGSNGTELITNTSRGQIETDVVTIPKNDPDDVVNGTAGTRAEVLLLVPGGRARMKTGDHFSASSMLMDYSEDTRKLLITENIDHKISPRHRRRHQLSRDYQPNEIPSDQPFKDNAGKRNFSTGPTSNRFRVRVPIKALLYGERTSDSRPSVPSAVNRGTRFRHPIRNNSWISLHSPIKIYIPVSYKDENSILSGVSFKDCVQCPSNFTLVAEPGKDYARVPVPAISICSRLALRPGSMNVAVTVMPRPGTKVTPGQHPVELIVWKPGGHVYSCRYTLTIKGSAGKSSSKNERTGLACAKPDSPTNGTVVCNWNGDGPSPEGSVCQFFCFPGFQISGPESGEAISVCTAGKWSLDSSVLCAANHCSKPLSPEHGSVKCHNPEMNGESDTRSKYRNGTLCHFRCRRGYVVPTSQLPTRAIQCHAPRWNVSSIPECKRATFPKHHPDDCRNRTHMVKPRGHVSFDRRSLLPWFAGEEGRPLTPTCSLLGKKLTRGVHPNFCEVVDPELRVTANCKYFVHVRERGPVYPHPRDCRNRTQQATRNGTVVLKVPRFFTKIDGESTKVAVPGTCTYSGEVGVGSYVNHCAAIDPETNSTAHCTYTVTVQTRSCLPPPPVDHATVHCGSVGFQAAHTYPPGTTCVYTCEDGYVLPRGLKKWSTKRCHPKLSWKPNSLPHCVEAIPPSPRPKDCKNQMLFLRDDKLTKTIKSPRFKSSYQGSKVKVKCSLSGSLPVGNYTNFCEAMDVELGITSNCKYNVVVRAVGCTPLPTIPYGSVQCSTNETQYGIAVGTTCMYECQSGFVVPTSQLPLSTAACTEKGQWSSGESPECITMVAPVPKQNACLNETATVEHLSEFTLKSPEFLSHRGTTLFSNCTPSEVPTYGVHDIICTAFDPEIRIPSSCEFTVDIRTGKEGEEELQEKGIECEPPVLPAKGFTDCLLVPHRSSAYHCRVFCESGFEFPSEFENLRNGSIECDGTDGMWDFQRLYNIKQLPECLGVLPTTAMRVWLSFNAAVESCEEDQLSIFQTSVNQSLLSLNRNMCQLVDCESSLLTNCSWDDKRNRFLLRVNWTIQAEYDPQEYEGTDLVPPVETQIENILETTQKAVTTEETLRQDLLKLGVELTQDSYRRGHFKLVCMTRGYGVDPRTDKCMECPRGTMEADGYCEPCPEGQHQLDSGQVQCVSEPFELQRLQ